MEVLRILRISLEFLNHSNALESLHRLVGCGRALGSGVGLQAGLEVSGCL